MRIIFCGSGSFATPSLQAILKTDHEVVAVVTQPPRRSGRGRKLHPTAIGELACEAGLCVLDPPTINTADVVEALREFRPDIICVAEFGQMVRQQVRQLATLDAFNLHASLLPELRGAAPVNWAIIRGYRRTGVTTFSLVDRVDAGPMYLQAETDIEPGETADRLRARLAVLGADVVCRTVDLLASGKAQPCPQDEDRITVAPMLKKPDGIVRWQEPAETIRGLIHGTWPWPGAHALLRRDDGKETDVIIASADVTEGLPEGDPGAIASDLAVQTGRGRLRIREIKPAGKRLMAWRDFANGYRIRAGDCFVAREAVSE